MAEGVVDGFEIVEVEQMGGHDLAPGMRQGLLEAVVEENAIWQAGQSVVLRHVRDLGFRNALFGDVLMCCYPAPIRHGLVMDREGATVR